MITGRFELHEDGKFLVIPDNEQPYIESLHPWTGRVASLNTASIVSGWMFFTDISRVREETDPIPKEKKYRLDQIVDCVTMQPLFIPGNNMNLRRFNEMPPRRFMSHDQALFEEPDDKPDQEILGHDK